MNLELAFTSQQGLFCHLLRVLEFLRAADRGELAQLHLNIGGCFGAADFLAALFEPAPLAAIARGAAPPGTRRVSLFPWAHGIQFSLYEGIHGTEIKEYVTADGWVIRTGNNFYNTALSYTNPTFPLYRARLAPVVAKYFHLSSDLQARVAAIRDELRGARRVLGFHIRFKGHYVETETEDSASYVDSIEREIAGLVADTVVYLATLCQPIVDCFRRHCRRLVVQDIARQPTVDADWDLDPRPMLSGAEEALVDAYVLATHCDQVYGGPSNVLMWAACVNPSVPIIMLDKFKTTEGN